MSHYKAPDNSVHFLDDGSFVHLLPEGSVPITDEEAEALRPKPPLLTYADLRAAAYPSIQDQLDTIFHRGLDAWKAEIQVVKDTFSKTI
jgi:hypothetical protein